MPNVTYNASGDIVWKTDPNGRQFIYNLGDVSWVLTSVGNVFILAAGVGFFYSGLLRRKNSLSALYVSMASIAVVTIEWFLWGFTLSFSGQGNVFIGNLRYAFLRHISVEPPMESPRISIGLYCVYELMFAATTAVIATGAIAERGRLGPILVFVFLWSTIVYNPIACWTWNPIGWGRKLGVLDFAGGIAVHATSGASALAISIYLRPRYQYSPQDRWSQNNLVNIILGTVMMWYGWFGFNGGSALSANLTAVQAVINTNIAAAAGGITGVLINYQGQRKWSSVCFCSGVVAGLITITPGSGYVCSQAALFFGVAGSIISYFAPGLKKYGGYDDSLDIFASHGLAGFFGSIFTGIFAQSEVIGVEQPLGWLDKHWKQVPIQIAVSVAAMTWAFSWTFIILKITSRFRITKLRASDGTQSTGLDDEQMGEQAFDMEEFPNSDEVNRQIMQTVARTLAPHIRRASREENPEPIINIPHRMSVPLDPPR